MFIYAMNLSGRNLWDF